VIGIRYNRSGALVSPIVQRHASERGVARAALDRDGFSSNRHLDLSPYLSMIFSENRWPLFRIMLYPAESAQNDVEKLRGPAVICTFS
jgi:hypothetical protein